jgi:hypothetical protein
VNSGVIPKRHPRLLAGFAGAAATLLLGWVLISQFADSPSDTAVEPAATGTVLGLPPLGATPSDPAPGELVLQWESSLTVPGMMWIYADGRVISQRPLAVPEGVGEEYSGLSESRLTPEGVEYLHSQVIATGLFGSDLILAREGNAPFLMISAQSGYQMVGVTWAWRGITDGAPVATPEQENALRRLDALLSNPESWPASVWEDETLVPFVPSSYSVCFGVSVSDAEPGTWVGKVDAALVWALLPEPAHDLLAAGVPTEEDSVHQDGGCRRMATDDARALALLLQEAGIHRVVSSGTFWPQTYEVAFELSDQAIPSDSGLTGDAVYIQFGPVLPHGRAVWWGPG